MIVKHYSIEMAHPKRYKAALAFFWCNLHSERINYISILKVCSIPRTGSKPDIKIDFVIKEKEGYVDKSIFDRQVASDLFNFPRDENQVVRLILYKRRRCTIVIRPDIDEEDV